MHIKKHSFAKALQTGYSGTFKGLKCIERGTSVSNIRKYSSTSYVGMGQVQNGVLYLRYKGVTLQ